MKIATLPRLSDTCSIHFPIDRALMKVEKNVIGLQHHAKGSGHYW